MRKTFTFKELVRMIPECRNENDIMSLGSKIDISFEDGKITWNDHETLFDILRMLIK